MKDTKTKDQALNGPQQALQSYLNELLQETNFVPEEPEEPTADADATAEQAMADVSAESVLEQDSSLDSAPLEPADTLEEEAAEADSEILHEAEFDSAFDAQIDVSETQASSAAEMDYAALDASFAEFETAIQTLQAEYSPATQADDIPTWDIEANLAAIANEAVEDYDADLAADETAEPEPEVIADSANEQPEDDDPTLDLEQAFAEVAAQEAAMLEAEMASEPEPVVDSEVSADSDPVTELEAVEPEPENEPEAEQTDIAEIESSSVPEPSKYVAKTEPLPWAKSRFECLLFYVGGLKMAVPLVELGGIYQSNDDKLTEIFGQPKWFMGMANVGEHNIRTVDTARWVMPNHYDGDLKDNFKFVIQLDRTDWGLACEKVAEAISLEPSQVKWRSDRSRRPWLAGTVIEHMCAILDVQGFIELLEDPVNGFRKHLKD
ncbi:chemotaxis protein CheW [Marinomonas aquimarina]|nr:chemotaxis protein CheW [Marinomonas aquimarina]